MSDFEFIGHINMADSKTCRKGLSLKRKIEITQEVERHPTKQRKIIAEVSLAPSTLATIFTAKEKHKSHYFGGEDTAACQRMRCDGISGTYPVIMETRRPLSFSFRGLVET